MVPEFQPAPGLSLFGQETSAGAQLLRLLHCLCRHALELTRVTAAGLQALPTEWDLTLLIHQPELSAELEWLLSIGRKRFGLVPRSGRVKEFRCAVGTYTELGGIHGAGTMPRLEIPVGPAFTSLPILDEAARQKITNEFQPKLLAYRLANFSKVLTAEFAAPDLTPAMRELAKSLAACTPDDTDLQAQVHGFLQIQDRETRSAAWLERHTVIIEAILATIHEAKRDCIYVGEIAEASAVILENRDEKREVEPRVIGPKLRALGLNTEPRDRQGIRLLLTKGCSRRVHELANYYAVPSVRDGVHRCPFCKES